jgi:hypothetical protein
MGEVIPHPVFARQIELAREADLELAREMAEFYPDLVLLAPEMRDVLRIVQADYAETYGEHLPEVDRILAHLDEKYPQSQPLLPVS